MSDATTRETTKPAYVSFATLENFVGSLKEKGVPSRIDRSLPQIKSGMSGATQNQLISGLRFLGLIDQQGAVSDDLQAWVRAHGTDMWGTVVRATVDRIYGPIIGDLDPSKCTEGQLREAFQDRAQVPPGQMLMKSVRFYLHALRKAGATVSAHVPTPGASGGTRRASPRRKPQADTPAPAADTPPLGTIRFPIPIPGKPAGHVQVPEDITEAECGFVELVLQYLKLHAKQRTGSAAALTRPPKQSKEDARDAT